MTEALADTRVVTLNGARQAGKSTLARITAMKHPDTVVRLLDDPATLRAAQDDPAGFVEHDGLMVIDEVQLAPWLFRSIKVAVDTDPRPGQFLLTGSAQVLALRGLPDALPGRMEIIELWPFSQGELERSPDAFADAAFARGPGLFRTSTMRKRDYLDRVVRGGYPEAIRRSPRRRAAFFDSYLTNLIERDVKELAAIERRGDLRRLLATPDSKSSPSETACAPSPSMPCGTPNPDTGHRRQALGRRPAHAVAPVPSGACRQPVVLAPGGVTVRRRGAGRRARTRTPCRSCSPGRCGPPSWRAGLLLPQIAERPLLLPR